MADAALDRRGQLLMASGSGPDRGPFVFFPILVGFMAPPRSEDGDSSPATDQIFLVSPLTQGMVVLRTEGSLDLAAAMQGILVAEEGACWSPPASKSSIEAMRALERPTGEAVEEEGEECAVCLDGLWAVTEDELGAEKKKKAEVVKEMPCKHRFHGGCIEKWLGMHGSCPVCRHRMPEENQPERKEGEEGEERRSVEREIWVTLGFSWMPTEQQQPQ